MKKRIVTILFFVVIFGLPISWYLFLQTFGENRFDLPVIKDWQNECSEAEAVLLVDSLTAQQFPNEIVRIKKAMVNQTILSLREFSNDSCGLISEVVLVDHNRQVRGEYLITREEVDRILAEVDIYILNYRNEYIKQSN